MIAFGLASFIRSCGDNSLGKQQAPVITLGVVSYHVSIPWQQQGIYIVLSNASRDQLRVLGSVVQDQAHRVNSMQPFVQLGLFRYMTILRHAAGSAHETGISDRRMIKTGVSTER